MYSAPKPGLGVHPPQGATVTGPLDGCPLGRAESNGAWRGFQKLIPRFTPSSRPISVNGVLIRRPGMA